MTTRLSQLSGTVVDQTSTGTPSGLTPQFNVAVERSSDSFVDATYWWDSAGSTWTVASTSSTFLIGAGLGVKNWTLALGASFYDLPQASSETYRIYTFGEDRVNNPIADRNYESTTEVKTVFSYRHSTPTLTSVHPPDASVQASISSITFTLDAQGAGIRQAWVVFFTTANNYWTGSSWTTTNDFSTTTDMGVWLTTDSATGGHPDMAFYPSVTESAWTLDFRSTSTIPIPTFFDAQKYSFMVRARNTAGQELSSGDTGHTVFFDLTAPTITAHNAILSLSSDTNNPSDLDALDIASGTIIDNVSDIIDFRDINLRIRDTVTSKYLDPNTLVNFNQTNGDNAWSLIQQITDEWSYDLSGAKYVAGNKYELEFYATDGAGNKDTFNCPTTSTSPASDCSTGDAATPKMRVYFRVDKIAPTVAIGTPTVTVPNYIGFEITRASGNASDLGFGVDYVEYALKYDQEDPTTRWQHHQSSGEWKAPSRTSGVASPSMKV